MEIKDFLNSVLKDFNISITTGYAGYLASDILYSAHNYVSAVNETVAVDFAHIHSYLGKRSLIIMKNAGLNEALLPIINSCILGTNAGMVMWVIDDLLAEGSEIAQNSIGLIKTIGIKPLRPKSWKQLYEYTRKAYQISESRKIPQIVLINNNLFNSKIEFVSNLLDDRNIPLKAISVLHPNISKTYIDIYNKHRQTRTSMFPKIQEKKMFTGKLNTGLYADLYKSIPKNEFGIVIGDFGTYTLAEGSIVQYGLHYSSAIACGVGAELAGKKPLVFVGEGGLTSGFESMIELIRKRTNLKIILIENGGISKQEHLGFDLSETLNSLKIPVIKISNMEVSKIADLLKKDGLLVVSVQY